MLTLTALPAFADNYIWLIHLGQQNVVVVDPGDAQVVMQALQTEQATSEILSAMWSDTQANWEGPPASYMLFVLRADALDVTYGTPGGFEALGIPYTAHIMPEKPW